MTQTLTMATPPDLATWQTTLTQVLLRPDMPAGPVGEAPPWLAALQAQPGFAVYRNTVMRGCVDALVANYPTVRQLAGDAWMHAMARAYVHAHPPTDGRLMRYGEHLPQWVAALPPAQSLPYLADVAQWDARWTQSHLAADAPPCTAAALAAQPPEALATLALRPHPAARWGWCDAHPAFTLWQRHRALAAAQALQGATPDDPTQALPDANLTAPLQWQGDGGLLTRPDADGAVQWQPLGRGGCALLDALHAHAPLAEATDHALHPDTDLPTLWAQLLQAGALVIGPASPEPSPSP